MKILSLNLNGENNYEKVKEKTNAKIYAFQESKIMLPKRTRINTVNIINENEQKSGLDEFQTIWKSNFSWLDFPENYFDEDTIDCDGLNFIIINVHLAGFWSGLRYPLMFVLLKRLEDEKLKENNVILVGDFNAQKVKGNSTSLEKKGSDFLTEITRLGFIELTPEIDDSEKITYCDKENIGYRYDHAFIRYKDEKSLYQINVEYFPKSLNEKWMSDHRGIILDIESK